MLTTVKSYIEQKEENRVKIESRMHDDASRQDEGEGEGGVYLV